MTARPPLESRMSAFAALRERLRAADPETVAALESAERAFEALAFERASLASRLAASTEQIERQLHKALTIGRVAETVNSSLRLDVVLRRVLDVAVEVMGAQRGFLMTANEDGRLEVAGTYGIDPAELDADAWRPSRSTCDRVFESGEPIVTTDAQADPRFSAQLSVRALKLRSIICVPLAVRNRRIGVVYLDSRVAPGLFGRQDPELLTALANQAALAIENARLFDEQRAVLAAITDGVITVDRGRIASFNEAAAATFGVAATSWIGRTAAALDDLAAGLSEVARDAAGPARELHGRHPARGELILAARASRLGGRRDALAIAISDLTPIRALQRLHADEVEHRERVRAAFARYLAPHVVEELMQRPGTVRLGGERATATIVFADLVGFTELAERLDAERVVDLLNRFFGEAVRLVFAHDGLLDKFYGDGLMAVFGPPDVRADDPDRAVACARALHAAAAAIDVDGVPLRLAVGIASGDVVAGHIGSPERTDYTVIGDAANLASRLEGAASSGQTYVDEATYARLAVPLAAERLVARIRGKAEPVTVYALTAS